MTTNKRLADLTAYKSVLPYASEMFGVYQPLLGWRSKRIEERFQRGFEKDKAALLDKLKAEFTGLVELTYATSRVDVGLNLARHVSAFAPQSQAVRLAPWQRSDRRVCYDALVLTHQGTKPWPA